MKKIIISIILLTIITAFLSFYTGVKYQTRKNPSPQFPSRFSSEQRQKFIEERGQGINFISGEVIAKDEQSLTIKLPDNNTKIIFLSDSTQITKTVEATREDIEIGKKIIISGEQASNGIYTAKTIQLSPPGQPNHLKE